MPRERQFGVLGAKQLAIGEVGVVWDGVGLAARPRFIALLKDDAGPFPLVFPKRR